MFGRQKPQPVSGLPTLGKPPVTSTNTTPVNMDPETYKVLTHIADDFIEEIKTSNYIEIVTNLAQFLQNQLLIKGIVNENVPRVWDIFGEKIATAISKIANKDQREAEFTQKDFQVIWELFARWHNNRLRKLKFADFINAERENNEPSSAKYSGATEVNPSDDND